MILAAGEGTRMRSGTPKVLHEICGRPMILWPVVAAREAGAGRIVVVDSPARALEGVLPEYAELAVQPLPNGTGGALAAALEHMDSRDGAAGAPGESSRADGDAVVVLSGDVPLVSAELISGLI
ncbi:MAG TPA: NTP transferase domain-containing protein, partial [Usitatibacter sp.]|nr:NTP transferase domain-containing protein [Usitatibacter sp.]